ncbi:MAG: hypothetical protein TH68_01695 [Candidatus Synechococcus spongiarum 142]|uniref:AIR synthase n=1 Tax=Candidatus Synechococcus spongiarum 142 TaxID=1608213 RepID=A0A6N3X6H2_9SYNE|nr:MAG: hypothetical protein TH68_01695 [Candidatus Synechococcus spongiarum 142]
MVRHAPFQITPQAAAELSRQAALTSRPGVASLELQPGGCQGWALIIRAGVVVGDPMARTDGITLWAHQDTVNQLESMHLDHHHDLRGGGFILRGPKDVQFCTCGVSFSRPSKDADADPGQ